MTAIAALTVLSWICLTRMSGSNSAGAGEAMSAAMGMSGMAAWGWAEVGTLFLMWATMMSAMMLPSVTPVLLVVVAVYQRRGVRATQLTATFSIGYLLAWTVFSAFAATAQYGLHRAALMEDLAINSALLGGIVLMVAGAYQSLPLKAACLTHCRSPLAFLAKEWREGAVGALKMGSRHGLYCVGCCWALMMLLFAAGVMNLFWVAAIAVLVLVEKVAPRGMHVGQVVGVALILWGAWLVGYGLSA
jgi:predicted metal-binding membrane protein